VGKIVCESCLDGYIRSLGGGASWGSISKCRVPKCGPRRVRRFGRRYLEALIGLESPGSTVAECCQQYISVYLESDPFSYADESGSLLLFGHPGGRVVFAM
jgi:hypothetical protein